MSHKGWKNSSVKSKIYQHTRIFFDLTQDHQKAEASCNFNVQCTIQCFLSIVERTGFV